MYFDNGRGSWVAELWLRDQTGRRYVRRRMGDSEAKAKRLRRELERQYEFILDPGDGSQTVAVFLEKWLEGVARQRVRASTFPSYASIVHQHLVPGIGGHRLDRLAPEHVAALLAVKTAGGLSPRRVQYIRAVLRMALSTAVEWGLCGRNVATLVTPPRSEREKVVAVTPSQAREILKAIAVDRLAPLYVVAIASGARQGELLGLQWSALDLEAGRMTIRRTLTRIDRAWSLSEPKTDSAVRTIPLPTIAIEALHAQRRRQLEERLKAGDRWGVPVGQVLEDWSLVFTTATGAPLHAGVVTPRLHQLLKAAGVPSMTFHQLRHACATLLLQAGVNPRVLQDVLGHSSYATTAAFYLHVAPAQLEEAAASMNSLLVRV